jgi:hypothetical protein
MKFTCTLESEARKAPLFVSTIPPDYKPKTSNFEEILNFQEQKIQEKKNAVVYNVVKKKEEMDLNIN